MLKNKDIICISSIDWDFIWQGHQEIMSALAKNGNRVLFMENTGVRMPGVRDISRIKHRIKNWLKGIKGIRQESKNLYIFSPMVLPFPYLRLARWLNSHSIVSILQRWMKAADFDDPIIWTFLPTPLTLDIAEHLKKKLFVYYCIDNFSASSVSVGKIRVSEAKLLKEADLVFVTSKALYEYCSRSNDEVHLFPFAVNYDLFEKARQEAVLLPAELKGLPKPIIGYVGGLHKWVDLELVKRLAGRFPDFSFVFVGPEQTDISTLSGIKNIFLLGKQEHSKVPFFIKGFDICLIPYIICEYTKNVYPTKLNEYLAMGKAVIATNLPELVSFKEQAGDIVYVAKNEEEFASFIQQALKEDDLKLRNARIIAAQGNSWESRIEKMSGLIEAAIERKREGAERAWRDDLAYFYRVARRKAVAFSVLTLCAYLMIFRTPLLWVLAEPLRISDMPRKADCIVVFAGGVGESGQPGQGYEERVKYAVELYKQGLASRMIFSSGYSHFFKEPQLMKILAVSLGVPESAVLLEDRAANTYENVLFTRKILDSRDLKSILLVSSPYHMRRVSLTFRKVAGNIQVLFTPVQSSFFYSHRNAITLQQLEALLHEFAGIAYYWIKGYI